MGWEMKHPLALRGRDLPNRAGNPWQTAKVIVHKTSGSHALVSLVVTDSQGSKVKDTRLGEVWVPLRDAVGRELSPIQLLLSAVGALAENRPARLAPNPADDPA